MKAGHFQSGGYHMDIGIASHGVSAGRPPRDRPRNLSKTFATDAAVLNRARAFKPRNIRRCLPGADRFTPHDLPRPLRISRRDQTSSAWLIRKQIIQGLYDPIVVSATKWLSQAMGAFALRFGGPNSVLRNWPWPVVKATPSCVGAAPQISAWP